MVPHAPGSSRAGARARETARIPTALRECPPQFAQAEKGPPVAHRVTFIRGDGTGPEISEATARVREGTGVEFDWDWQDAGADVYEEEGTPLPDRVLDSIKENKIAIKGPITTPVGSGFRSIFDDEDVDLVIVRENHEDLYAGVEFEKGTDETEKLRQFIKDTEGTELREDIGVTIKAISVFGTQRIVREAFEYAKAYGRKKVTLGHKANIMKHSDGLFLKVGTDVAENEYGDSGIEFEERIIDNLCNQLVSRPAEYDVLVLPNLYGDVVSDLAAGMIGGLGVAPGANVGDDYAVFEATHGSAPKYKGQNKVNPSALMLSGVMMLRHLEETEAADRLEGAIAEVIKEGENVTYDLKADRDDPSAVGTSEYADAIIEKMKVAA